MNRETYSKIHELFDHRLEVDRERAFIYLQDRSLSCGDLEDQVAQLEAEMIKLGVRSGDRVLIVAENCPEHVSLIIACSRIGAWSCGVNARMTLREIQAFARRADVRMIYFTSAVSDAARVHAESISAIPSVLSGLQRSSVQTNSVQENDSSAAEVAAIIFTSGTTGQPKGVLVSHQGLIQFAHVSAECRRLTADDRVYAYLPMTHIFGLGTILMTSLLTGAPLVMRSTFSAVDTLDAIATKGITNLLGPSTFFVRMIEHLDRAEIARPDAPSLRYLYTGAGPLDLKLKRAVEARFSLPLHHGYGMSEYAGSLHVTRLESPRSDTSSGHVVSGAELRIVDPSGKCVAAGEKGEVWVRGVGLMPGYFRDDKETKAVMRPGGWYATGDVGQLDADGALFIVGRLKEMIVRSGFKVYPAEIEAVLNEHPSVQQSAVVGQRTEDGGEDIIAFVQGRGGAEVSTAELKEFMRERLSPYKVPARIVAVIDFPMTHSGKILKRELLRSEM